MKKNKKKSPSWKRVVLIWTGGLAGFTILFLVFVLWILPGMSVHYEPYPAFNSAPKVTTTKDGSPADPINIVVIGNHQTVQEAMNQAGWIPADSLNFLSGTHAGSTTGFGTRIPSTPVSNLYLFGKMKDLAFEKKIQGAKRWSYHARFWLWKNAPETGQVWLGSVTLDYETGKSHFNGAFTRHIAADLDEARETLAHDLFNSGRVNSGARITGIGPKLFGKNAAADHYYTDGEMWVGTIGSAPLPDRSQPVPFAARLQNQLWKWLRFLIHPMNRTSPGS